MYKIASILSLIIICCSGCKEACVHCESSDTPIFKYDSIVNVHFDTLLHRNDTQFIKVDTTYRFRGLNFLDICPGTPKYALLQGPIGGGIHSYWDTTGFYNCY